MRGTGDGVPRGDRPPLLNGDPHELAANRNLLKGLFLGLVLYAALDQAAAPPGEKAG